MLLTGWVKHLTALHSTLPRHSDVNNMSLFFTSVTIFSQTVYLYGTRCHNCSHCHQLHTSRIASVTASHSAILCDVSSYFTVVFHIVRLKSPLLSSSPLHHWLSSAYNTQRHPHTSQLDTKLAILNMCALHHSQSTLLIHLTALTSQPPQIHTSSHCCSN